MSYFQVVILHTHIHYLNNTLTLKSKLYSIYHSGMKSKQKASHDTASVSTGKIT